MIGTSVEVSDHGVTVTFADGSTRYLSLHLARDIATALYHHDLARSQEGADAQF